jgi:carotenoid cleavage dioxygenase-like enzyme
VDERTFDLNSGVLAPVATEVTIDDLAVTGELPPELNGTLFRNGPNPFDGHFIGADMLSWWVGPSMIHGLALHHGRALWYRNRWVRTGDFFRHHDPDAQPGAAYDQNPNVSIVAHAGRLLALGEGSLPFEIDEQLATVGPTDLDGALTGGPGAGGMTAHPKVDPVTGEMCFFRADWQAPFLRYGVLDTSGRRIVDQTIDLDGPSMMHDFAITKTRAVFFDLNVGYDFAMLEHGAAIPLRWHDEHVARIGITPRLGGPVQWVEIEPCFIQHVINAHDRGTDIVELDVVRYPSFLRVDTETWSYAPNPLGVAWRYTIHLDGQQPTVHEMQLADRSIELPRIDDAQVGRSARYAYAVEQPTGHEMRGIVKLDLRDGAITTHQIPIGDQNSEPIFVPRGQRPALTTDDDGWILSCVYRARSDTTDVVVLRSADIEAEPVAVVHLPQRVPAGFHGAWIDQPASCPATTLPGS